MPLKEKEDNIRVFLRVRPPIGREVRERHSTKQLHVSRDAPTKVLVTQPRRDPKQFFFHQAFTADSTQPEVYDKFAKDAVQHAVEGYHGVLFVYGQTGSGKTYTISNVDQGSEGVLQRAVHDLWVHIANDTVYDYDISVSYVQLYNELLTDMLEHSKDNRVRLTGVADRRTDVRLVREVNGESIERSVLNAREMIGLFLEAQQRRAQSSTMMNATSSRSHTVFNIYIRKLNRGTQTDMTQPKATEGRLIICDLAGSERVSKTQAEGRQLSEASHINSSLLVLGRVVHALTDRRKVQHAPFRESKLTRLLQYSLSGWGKTSLVVNVSPSDDNIEETLSAIYFGQRATLIKQKAEKHVIIDYKALYLELQKSLDQQHDRAAVAIEVAEREEYERRIAELEERVQLLDDENAILRAAAATSSAAVGDGFQPHEGSMSSVQTGGLTDRPSDRSESITYNGRTIQEILTASREAVEERDTQISDLRGETHSLKQDLGEVREQLLAMTTRLKHAQLYSSEREENQQDIIDDLSSRLAQAQGTEYIALDASGGIEMDFSDDLALEDIEAAQEEQTHRLIQTISLLKNELTEHLLYNERARAAIRMLHDDLEKSKTKQKS